MKEMVYTCDLCEREGSESFVVGIMKPTGNATRRVCSAPDTADKHICGDCVRIIRALPESHIPNARVEKSA